MALKHVPFKMVSEFAPAGDQPGAIAALSDGIVNGERYQTLLGITGSGKSATVAWTIEQVQKPTLVIAPNKSLAAQLANEFREFFPQNRVEYFVSYYDYYQPEAYIASSDTYIEKDSSVNDEIDRLRHSATSALLTRRRHRGGLGVLHLRPGLARGVPRQPAVPRAGQEIDQRAVLRKLVDMQYDRNDMNLTRASSGCGATRSSCTRPTTRRPCASSCSATRSSASPWSTRSPASSSARSRTWPSTRPPTT